MIARILPPLAIGVLAVVACCHLTGGEAFAQSRKTSPQQVPKKQVPKKQAVEQPAPGRVAGPNFSYHHELVVFVAKGAADSCGPGCDTWLAVEGTIDAGASQRFRNVLRSLKDRKLPIYISSPGGNGAQSVAMGRMLRERRALARVGRTLVEECSGSQTDAACLKLKRSGRELAAELTTQFAVCASGCPLVVVGATTREIAPEVPILVHSPRVVVPPNLRIPPEIRARVVSIVSARVNAELGRYFQQMGIDRGLLDAYLSVRHQDNRRLTREEMYRFRIDTRPAVTTAWRLETGSRPTLHRYIAVKPKQTEPFKTMDVMMTCDKQDVEFAIVPRVADKLAGRNVRIATGTDVLSDFSRNEPFNRWSRSVSWAQLAALSEAARATVQEFVDQQQPLTVFDLDLSGLQAESAKLAAICKIQAETPSQPSRATTTDVPAVSPSAEQPALLPAKVEAEAVR